LPKWTTHGSALRISKHNSFIWKRFSLLWPPMVLPSIWKNVFLQFQLWKFWVTQFWWQVRPLWPDTPLQSILDPPPQDIKRWQRFLNMLNFYCCFLLSCTHARFAAFNRSPEAWKKNIGKDRRGRESFSKSKAPPGSGGTTPTSFLPKAELPCP
jgi:hypothetical protein